MTACKDSLNGKKAVSATLAGVLAVGMVPAAAFAETAQADTNDEQGVELQSVESAKAFSEGTVTATWKQGDETKSNSVQYVEGKAVTCTPTLVTLKNGNTVDVTDAKAYSVTYFAADADGQPTGSEISAPSLPGKYVAVVTAKSGTYEGGKALAPFEITAKAFGALHAGVLDKDGKVAYNGATAATYTASAIDFGFTDGATGTAALKEGADYTVAYYSAGSDLTGAALSEAPKDAGDYVAVLTGAGQYTGSTAKVAFTIAQLDLSTVTFDDITTTSAAQPAKPTGLTLADGTHVTDPALLDQIKLTLDKVKSNVTFYDANQKYVFTAAPADSANGNFKKKTDTEFETEDVNVYKVKGDATFKYGKSAMPESLEIDAADGESFDEGKIAVYTADGKTKLVEGANAQANAIKITYADKDGKTTHKVDGKDTAYTAADVNAGGTWTVTVKVTPDYTAENKDNADYQLGGEATMTVKVKSGDVNADAKVYVSYDGKVVTSVAADYTGEDLIADKHLGVKVLDADGAEIASSNFTVTYTNEAGKEVKEIKDAGTYKMAITSDKYDLTGTTEVTIVVNKVDLSAIKVGALKTWGGSEYLELKSDAKDGWRFGELDLRYNTGKADSDDNDTATDKEGWDSLESVLGSGYDSALKVEKFDDEKGEWVDAKAWPRIQTAGDYRITLVGTEDQAKNFEFANDDNTTAVEFKAVAAGSLKFVDVTPDAWYFDVVADAADAKLMNGYNGTQLFGPNDSITRGQVACVLFNLANEQSKRTDVDYGKYEDGYGWKSFDDVDGNQYYGEAVAWAKNAGVVNGYADGTFKADQPVTREEFACMLANYAQKVGAFEASDGSALAALPDAGQVSAYATESVAWAVDQKIMGNGGVVNPGAKISRAEAAAMTVNYKNL